MHGDFIGGLVKVVCLSCAASAAGQPASDGASAVRLKPLYIGAAAQALISGSPGVAVAGLVSFQWEGLVVNGEIALGETFSGWDRFAAGAQIGAVLLPSSQAPYFLAGIERSTFVDIAHDGRRGRDDLALTGEAGYVLRRPEGGRQVWLGIRGIVPISSHVYNAASAGIPVVVLLAKFLI